MKELETERLLLRHIRRDDAQRIYDCWASDPEVTRYLTWQPHASVAVTEAIVARWLADYDKPDTYRYGIELRETGEMIGMIDVVGYHHGNPVIGYCSGRAYWGNGYMTEGRLFDDPHRGGAGKHRQQPGHPKGRLPICQQPGAADVRKQAGDRDNQQLLSSP